VRSVCASAGYGGIFLLNRAISFICSIVRIIVPRPHT
jgi:hypothetical protein